MSVRVADFDGLHEANSIQELERVLEKRSDENSNSFWLAHGSDKHPSLSLLVSGSLAGLHYFPRDSHPGFVPVGNLAGLTSGEMTTFYMDRDGEEVKIANDAVVPFPAALAAAKDFFVSPLLPTSIKWTEL